MRSAGLSAEEIAQLRAARAEMIYAFFAGAQAITGALLAIPLGWVAWAALRARATSRAWRLRTTTTR